MSTPSLMFACRATGCVHPSWPSRPTSARAALVHRISAVIASTRTHIAEHEFGGRPASIRYVRRSYTGAHLTTCLTPLCELRNTAMMVRRACVVLGLIVACKSEAPGPEGPPVFDEVWIPGGSFTMGHPEVSTITWWDTDFAPAHTVQLSAFFIDRY